VRTVPKSVAATAVALPVFALEIVGSFVMPIVAGAIADALHNPAFPLIIGAPRHSSSSCRLPRNEPSRPPFSSPTARRPRMPRDQTTSLTLSA